jgi:hypothetical protein
MKLTDGRIAELIDYAEEAVKNQPEDATRDMLSALRELRETRNLKNKRTISSIIKEIDIKMEEMEKAYLSKNKAEGRAIWSKVEALFGEAWHVAGKIRKQE